MKSIYMDSHWGVLQQEKEKGEAITYTFEENGMRIIYPFIKRKAGIVNGIEYFDLVTPRGECGPWIENCLDCNQSELIDKFNKEFDKYCAENNIIAEYIRFNPWKDYSQCFARIYDVHFHGALYCNDLTSDFFKNEYSSKKRNEIRKAEKNNIQIIFDKNSTSIDEFLELYSFTKSKYQLGDYYSFDRDFIEKYCKLIPDKMVFVKALYEGKIISYAIILLGEDIGHYHFAANNPEYTSLQGNSLLIYKAALYVAEKGKKLFDLGGAREGSALEKFKKSFVYRGKEYSYDIGTKIRNDEIYAALVKKVGGPREGYFPAYRR